MKYVIYGAGAFGKQAAEFYGISNVILFIDNYKIGLYLNRRILTFDKFIKTFSEDKRYKLILAIQNVESNLEVQKQLTENNIKFDVFFSKSSALVRIDFTYGKLCINADPVKIIQHNVRSNFKVRYSLYKHMINKMFLKYKDYFSKKNFTLYLQLNDNWFMQGISECKYIKNPIMAPCTFYGIDNLYAIPTYSSYHFTDGCACIGELIDFDPDSVGGWNYIDERIEFNSQFSLYNELPKFPNNIEYNQAIWAGSIYNNNKRRIYKYLADKYPNYFKCIAMFQYGEPTVIDPLGDAVGEKILMSDYNKYKYILDIPGITWSDRFKFLLCMGRPVLRVDRDCSEYFDDKLLPMVHYVPVKADMSDLVEKIEMLNNNPQLCKVIVANANKFSS